MQDFIIVTPQYFPNSNGIRTLHKICHTINKIGGKARLVFIDSSDPNCATVSLRDLTWTNQEWNTPPLQQSEMHLIDTSYVLYPEVMIGNPLGAKKVIRYFGNREGYCNGKKIGIGPSDFLLAHSVATRKDAHYVLFNSEINPVFNHAGSVPTMQRSLDATYIGKGYLYGQVGIVNNTLLIGRDWPKPQEQLAVLLRSVRIFYTWDSWTQTNVEAVLCGAIPCFLRYEPWTEEDLDGSEIGRIPRLDNNNQVIDINKFQEEQKKLIDRVAYIASSWDERVRTFTQKVEQHFR